MGAGRREKIRDCHKRRPRKRVASMTSSAAVDCPQDFFHFSRPRTFTTGGGRRLFHHAGAAQLLTQFRFLEEHQPLAHLAVLEGHGVGHIFKGEGFFERYEIR